MVMTMRTDKSRKCHEAVLFIVVGGGRGGDWVNNWSKQPSWSFYDEQDSNDDDYGGGDDADDSDWLWTSL